MPDLTTEADELLAAIRCYHAEALAVLEALLDECVALDRLARRHQPELHPVIVAHMERLLDRLALARQVRAIRPDGTRQ